MSDVPWFTSTYLGMSDVPRFTSTYLGMSDVPWFTPTYLGYTVAGVFDLAMPSCENIMFRSTFLLTYRLVILIA